jgi:hypothetical protein
MDSWRPECPIFLVALSVISCIFHSVCQRVDNLTQVPNEMSTEKKANAEFIERFLQLIGEKANGKPTIFARMAGIPPSTLFGYVNGRFPTHEHLLRIRDTFNVNINWLVSGEGDPYGSPPEGESAEPAYGYNLPEMPGGLDDARGVVNELLRMAKKVLLSGNRQAADALERNIRYFNHAVEIEGRLSGLEEKMGSLEERLKKKGILGGSGQDEAI